MEHPKLFISYSWSSPTHEEWVLQLATELREASIDVILDKWDLKEGHDSVVFMEKIVTDPTVKKVVIVSDKIYAEKADGRLGGVGTETQIISKEIYERQEQDKFVVVVTEKDDLGKPYLPTYYKSRIYIDLSEGDNYVKNFETLVRWVYDKPLHVKPDLGKRPTFLEETIRVSLGTSVAHKRAITAIKENKPFATGAVDEYLNIFSEHLERFRISKTQEGEFDEAVVKSIEDFTLYRNESIQLFFAIGRYAPSEENINRLHRFFESLLPYMDCPKEVRAWSDIDFDNFKFIVHELFLYAIAILLKFERFEQANVFLTQPYYIEDYRRGESGMASFSAFREYIKSLEQRNQRLKQNRLSLHSDMLKQRSHGSGIEFRDLMQADFVLFMRAEIDNSDWWPETLMYTAESHNAFEIFVRSVSKSYFDKIKCLLGIRQVSDLAEIMGKYQTNQKRLPRWGHRTLNPALLIGFDRLCQAP